MDVSVAPILELGTVLSLAAAAGWIARRAGLPAVVGYLALGLAISPFTAVLASVAITIVGSTVLVRLVGPPHVDEEGASPAT